MGSYPLTQHQSGAVAELYVASRLAAEGFSVYYPLMTQSRCDLVIEDGGVFFKVQVKKASWSSNGTYKYLQARLSGKNKQTNTPYKKEDVDYFAFTDLSTVWLAPFEDIGHQTSVCLTSTNPKYKPQTKYDATEWIVK